MNSSLEGNVAHSPIIGKTGTGKSTLIEQMVLQDLQHGNGLALIDPHGDLVERIADRVPPDRRSDVFYLNATDPTQPYGYNPLRRVRVSAIEMSAVVHILFTLQRLSVTG